MNYSSEQRDSLRIVAIVVGMLALTAILWPPSCTHTQMKGLDNGTPQSRLDMGGVGTRQEGNVGADLHLTPMATSTPLCPVAERVIPLRTPEVPRCAGMVYAGEAGAPLPMGISRLFGAIRQVESGGNDRAVGDGGKSRGPYQVQRAYWREAVAETDAADWSYDKWVGNPDRAGYVVYLHWCKVCPAALRAGDCELLARCHRLPNDPWRKDNDKYWFKVKEIING